MIVSAWYDGHSSYGVRILERDISLWFRPEWERVTVALPDLAEPVEVVLTASFWHGSPELRSPHLRDFLRRHGLDEWPPHEPPRFQLEPLGDGRFELKWLRPVAGQRTLPLEL
jgi:hypothetical protein